MKEIRGDAKNVRTLLGGQRFAIEYYQREYRWATKQVTELLDDLCGTFLDSYKEGDARNAVEQYGRYFLGSVIISDKDGKKHIIDGQQRMTTLTLLLIFIHHLLDETQKTQLAELIFTTKFGKQSFNLDVEERNSCMQAIFDGENITATSKIESVNNIIGRYQDIEDNFHSEDITLDSLPYFADWLIENVYLVEITAYSDNDAYTIFETMNDRGLSLTPTEMLKGYMLANISDIDARNSASKSWTDRVNSLRAIGKEEDADAIKSWLRSQYAETIRDRSKGAVPKDFDRIASEFHRWVRETKDVIGLSKSEDYARLINKNFEFYASWYEKIRNATMELKPGLEEIYYTAHDTQLNFTLQYPVLLAPLRIEDSEDTIMKKLAIVSSYIDIMLARRIWNFKSISSSNMQYNMYILIILKIRNKSIEELREFLIEQLEVEENVFSSQSRFHLHGQNGRYIHWLLARMTDYVEVESGNASRYIEFSKRSGRNAYQIEHIWANHFDRHTGEFKHEADFQEYRNRVGGLLLLPRNFNASFGDMEYSEKREHYFGQNLLAASLCDQAYSRNPGFSRFIENSELEFEPHSEFKNIDLDKRQRLYLALAEKVWDPERLLR